jgi:hypothetical protein
MIPPRVYGCAEYAHLAQRSADGHLAIRRSVGAMSLVPLGSHERGAAGELVDPGIVIVRPEGEHRTQGEVGVRMVTLVRVQAARVERPGKRGGISRLARKVKQVRVRTRPGTERRWGAMIASVSSAQSRAEETIPESAQFRIALFYRS